MNLSFQNKKYMILMTIFIISQPILDIMTYFSITYFQANITPGIVIRMLFMLITITYIFFSNNQLYKKKIIIYLLILFSVIGFSFVMNFLTKPNFYFFQEVQFYVKSLYFPVMFCGILLAFSNGLQQHANFKILKPVTVAMLIFSVSMFIAILTGTSATTYYVKSGYSGWFYAGNEISAIAAICFPIVLLYSIIQVRKRNNFLYWFPTLLLLVAAFLIGTKVGYLAILLTVVSVLFVIFVLWISNLRNGFSKNVYNRDFFSIIVLLVVLIALSPLSPAVNNISQDYKYTEESSELVNPSTTTVEKTDKTDQTSNEETVSEAGNILDRIPFLKYALSSRNIYFLRIYNDFQSADVIHKLFGMGYAGFYHEQPKLIEMDFFDLFFSFGILGFIIFFLPLFYVIYLVLKSLFTNIKGFFSIENILLIVSCSLGFGIAALAGHVLYAPAVSIYLSLSIVLLINFQKSIESANK